MKLALICAALLTLAACTKPPAGYSYFDLCCINL